ncbi:PREDICTED: low-density lipoprotein receptor-related protein 4 [Nicrophorus vespilloides]|uniref:Low-density lipoprotein receptor-related protein 4 n=1 Tax=Nicrophorus vespilloides TaxID=110193 RepID=A0ABM1M5I6_NICVS|nr:PREDICTED: low-density lipoprotein receptor-related protein 4 [Nicrophorus vespilloides]
MTRRNRVEAAKRSRGRGHFQICLVVCLLTLCFANHQSQDTSTSAPPPVGGGAAPHRGAARQMYGSGSLRPPGTNPMVFGPAHRPPLTSGSSPSQGNIRRYPMAYPIVPLPIPIRDFESFPDGFPILIREYFNDRSTSRSGARGISTSSASSSINRGMYGGRPEYNNGRPTRLYDFRPDVYGEGFIPGRGFDVRPGGMLTKMPSNRPTGHGIQRMREPDEDDAGVSSSNNNGNQKEIVDFEHECGEDCEQGEYLCVSSCTCIKNTLRCDGDVDCDDEEDELECGEIEAARDEKCTTEPNKYVTCPRSGKCILKNWLCDGDDDCGDFSDETQCGFKVNCTSDQFECANGLCIPRNWECDNDNDCKDFSDEHNCTKMECTTDEYSCGDGTCISLSFKCDKDIDCNDESDETDCDVEPPPCNEGEFRCTYNKCIKVEFRCDGDNDCDDWSDEENCPKLPGTCVSGEFKCNNGQCIPESWRCDKQDDCEGNEDEINCTDSNSRNCSSDEFMCSNGACILKTWVCDGVSDCNQDEDESNCQIVCDETKFGCTGISPNDTEVDFCIHKKHVCDGQRDCPKGEDENDCPTRHDCDINKLKCTQMCITFPNGTEGCSCHPGYNLVVHDGYTCEDINECLYETDPVCSQTCNNTVGSFKCGCMTGYVLRPDMRSCKALGAPPTLLFANRGDIRQVSLQASFSNSKYTAILKRLSNAIALDYHYTKGLIFWSDTMMNVIRKANMNGSGIVDVVKWGLESPGGIALDWIHNLLFWTDSGTRRVEVASLDGKQRAIIVTDDLDKPRAIAVHPGKATVFWTDWGPNPKIERVEMDGTNRRSVITESVFWPNGLTIDYTTDRIYWADAKHNVIETALFDGGDRKKVISKGLPHPFALTIFEDAIYWTDWHTKAISTANKATGAGFRTIHSNLHFPMDIHSYHPQRQPDYRNHCGSNNGGCEHLCLPNRVEYSCVCRMGQKLNADRKTCQQPENFLVLARKKDLRIKHLDTDANNHHEIVVPVDGVKSAVAIAWDSRKDTIFWTDVDRNTISKAHWNGSDQQIIIKDNILSPAGLAYDWFTDKLYWTSASKIEVAKSDGSMRTILIWKNLGKPRDIVVDPVAGNMYWSDWGENPKIERAAMDGSNRILITNNLTWPNGLAIDHETGRLYWSDGGKNSIEYADLDGRHHKVLLSGISLPHPFGLDLFGEDVYWTDWETLKIEKVNKILGTNRSVVSSDVSNLMDVRVFHRNRKYVFTPCHKDNGGCSHLCLLKPEGHSCSCPIGIKLQRDGKTCAEFPSNYLVLAHRVDIRQISLDVPYVVDVVLPMPSLKNVMAVDVDRRTNQIYWTDTSSDLIQKNSLDGKQIQTIISHELQMADGIAVDSSGRKLYWTDGERNSIEVAELDGHNRKLLVWIDLDSPRAITLYYEKGLMFWSDWGTKAKIESAEMDGSNRKTLISTKLVWPNGLGVDHQENRLYWTDGKQKTIESCDLQGNDRRLIIDDAPHPYGLVIAGDHMYWTDWQTQSLHRADKGSGTNRTIISERLKGLMTVVHVKEDDAASLPIDICGADNGGCSHLCLRNALGFSCACPTGIQFMNNSRKICNHQPSSYLLFATRKYLARISLDSQDLLEVTLPINNTDHIIDVDFHWAKQTIFFSDVNMEKIMSVDMRNLSDVRDLIVKNITTPNGISVDWISNNLYWTDTRLRVIEVCRLDGDMRKIIVKENLMEPRSIAVYPRKGYLYWSDWGTSPKIEMAYTDGSTRSVIVDRDLGFPNGLVIDFKGRRLYWTDAKWDRIETSDLHGKSRIQLIQSGSSPTTHPFGLTQFDEYIYWTDWYQKTILRADKATGNNAAMVRSNLIGVMGITTVSESKQKGWNPCAVNNGGCSHLCFFKLNHYTCGCPDSPNHPIPCKTAPEEWVTMNHPDAVYDYEDYDYDSINEHIYPKLHDSEQPNTIPASHYYVMFIVSLTGVVFLIFLVIGILFIFRTNRKKYLYATGRSVMTFSNPNYYTSNREQGPAGPVVPLAVPDKKPFLWKRLKYDKSQDRVYEEKTENSSPEVASLIPTVLTPCSSNCDVITPEMERSPSATPLHRQDTITTVA